MSHCGSELPILGGVPSGGGGGSGNVVGPASSTDNAAARWDGATGQLLQDSVVIIGDTGDVRMRRLFLDLGTTLVNGDFALSASAGNTATAVVEANSKDSRGAVTVTINGSGIAANPTITLTWRDGVWAAIPKVQVVRNDGTGLLGYSWLSAVGSLTITLAGTPLAGETYIFTWMAIR